jgi:hypothetical protein
MQLRPTAMSHMAFLDLGSSQTPAALNNVAPNKIAK